MNKPRWTDRRILMMCVIAIAAIVIIGLFCVEIFTEKDVFTDTVVGVLIGATISTPLASYVTYYTAGKEGDD